MENDLEELVWILVILFAITSGFGICSSEEEEDPTPIEQSAEATESDTDW